MWRPAADTRKSAMAREDMETYPPPHLARARAAQLAG